MKLLLAVVLTALLTPQFAYKPQVTIRQDPTALRVDVVVEFKNQ